MTKTLDLRPGDKISHSGLIRTVRGIRPDTSWTIGCPGKQVYEILLKYIPGGVWSATGTVDTEWTLEEGEDGDLSSFTTRPAPAKVPDYAARAADDQAERHYDARIDVY
jgi:hypothetical protein